MILKNLLSNLLTAKLKGRATSGFTLIEALLAIVVTLILLSGIAQTLALTAAARVQARRVDLATQAARGYVEGIRSRALIPPDVLTNVDISSPNFGYPATGIPYGTLATDVTDGTNKGIYVDTDGDGFKFAGRDVVIVAARTCAPRPACILNPALNTPANATAQGYTVVLRVYRADGFNPTSRDPIEPLREGPPPSTLVGSLGSRTLPLFTQTTDIPSSNNNTNFDNFTQRTQ